VDNLHLARDLEDKRVVDRNGRELGRIDRVVLVAPPNGMAHVVAIEIGPSALGARLHPVVGRIVRAIELIFAVDDGRPVRVEVDAILSVGDSVKIDVAAGETAALAVEQRLRPFVRRFPGAKA
jgi:sporulation protein YlmC with PRC-barrel domain